MLGSRLIFVHGQGIWPETGLALSHVWLFSPATGAADD